MLKIWDTISAHELVSPSIPRLTVLTGPQGCGKTMYCLGLYEDARLNGLHLEGAICPGVFEGGKKVGFDVITLGDGRRRALARRSKRCVPGQPTCWDFDPATMQDIDNYFRALELPDFLVIDELGPVEFDYGGGWQSALSLIDSERYGRAVVVIRPTLLKAARTRWPWMHVWSCAGERQSAVPSVTRNREDVLEECEQ